jgi:hypothetical protein
MSIDQSVERPSIDVPVERPSIDLSVKRLTAHWRRLPVSWVTLVLLVILIAYADGFWVTSIQGAVGAFERRQPPFTEWLHDSTLTLPVYFAAILAALLIARHWTRHNRHQLAKLGAAVMLITIATTSIGVAQVIANSAYDYHYQIHDLAISETLHHSGSGTDTADHTGHAANTTDTCIGLCAERTSTIQAHVRAAKYASGALLLTNLLAIAWILALRNGQLWRRREAAVPPVLETRSLATARSLQLATPGAPGV